MFSTKTPLKGIALLLMIAFVWNPTFAQEAAQETSAKVESVISDEEATQEAEEPKFKLSGSVDAYFRRNLSGPNTAAETDGEGLAPATSFANLPGFSLGMVNVVGTYDGAKAGVVADLVFGPRGSDAVFNSPLYSNSAQIINQLNVYWKVSDKTKITLGKFTTFVGYEYITPTLNFNYSTSYLFSYGPFAHTGLKVDYAAESGLSLMAGVFDPTDITEFNPTNDFFYGAQVGYKGFYLNGLFGEGYSQVDLTGGFDPTEKLHLGVNASLVSASGDAGFAGAALYAQLATSENFKLGVRAEYFNDKDGNFVFGSDVRNTNALDLTLSANYKVGGLTIIPELRFDALSEDLLLDSDGDASGNLTSFVLAVVYGF